MEKYLKNTYVEFSIKALLVTLLTLSVILIGVNQFTFQTKKVTDPQTIASKGYAMKEVKPDVANLSFAAELKGTDPVKLQEQAESIITKSIEEVKKIGIEEDNIQTSNYSLGERYYDENDDLTFNITLDVKVENLENNDKRPGQIMKAVINSGLNKLNGVYYEVSNIKEIQDDLRNQAIENAKTKKAELEKSLGKSLGEIVSITENSPYYPMYTRTLDAVAESAPDSAMEDSGSSTILTGLQKLEYEVYVYFELN